MGTYTSIYLGVFIKVPIKEITITETKFVDQETGKTKKTKFCPDTGKEFKTETFTRKEKNHPSAYIEEDDYNEDEFWQPAYHGGGQEFQVFLLNSRNPKYVMDADVDNLDCINFIGKNNNYESIVEEFTKEYEKYINYYKEQYEEIEICYGLTIYAH
jgi:hypothetical protein